MERVGIGERLMVGVGKGEGQRKGRGRALPLVVAGGVMVHGARPGFLSAGATRQQGAATKVCLSRLATPSSRSLGRTLRAVWPAVDGPPEGDTQSHRRC